MSGPESVEPSVHRLTHLASRSSASNGAGDETSGANVVEFISMADASEFAREATFNRLVELVKSADPVPREVVAAAKDSFTWHSIDEELAELVYDSTFDGDLLAGVRAGGTVGRQLTFESSNLVLEVEVLDGPQRELTCQVVPPQPASLELRHRDGSIAFGRDEFGMFHVASVPVGPVSLRCIPLEGDCEPATTSWVTL